MMIQQREGLYYIKGSSEVFNSITEVAKRVKQLRKSRRSNFVSEKLKMSFRSNWEIELAELMHDLGIRFKYEPKRFYFEVERESYLPDFYLPDYNVWIEVKGFMDKRSAKRIKLFRKHYKGEYGFFLYEKNERELILDNPFFIFALIGAAQREVENCS